MKFTKKHLSFKEQIELLKKRGLLIPDDKFAIKKLSQINYYRLSAYFYPFFQEKDSFKEKIKFNEIIELYAHG